MTSKATMFLEAEGEHSGQGHIEAKGSETEDIGHTPPVQIQLQEEAKPNIMSVSLCSYDAL